MIDAFTIVTQHLLEQAVLVHYKDVVLSEDISLGHLALGETVDRGQEGCNTCDELVKAEKKLRETAYAKN